MMTDLTKRDVQEAFIEVLRNKELLDALIAPVISETVKKAMTDKLDKVFGIDCTDSDDRQEVRKDMEMLRDFRLYAIGAKDDIQIADLKFLRKWRSYYESEEGTSCIIAIKKIAAIVEKTSAGVVRGMVYFFVIGAIALIAYGASFGGGVKKLLGN
ncbi:MAG TPA: hypothetical protein VIY48_20205 [Candidatus Paceibacterota bacterium]